MLETWLVLGFVGSVLVGLGWATHRLLRNQTRWVRYSAAGAVPMAVAATLAWSLLNFTWLEAPPAEHASTPPQASPTQPAFLPPAKDGDLVCCGAVGPPLSPPKPPAGGGAGSSPRDGGALDLAQLIRAQVAELVPGQIVFNPPTKMRVGDPEQVTVRISRTLTESRIKENLQGRGVPQVEQIEVGTFMRVRLFGSGFEVMTKSDENQAVPEDHFAEWLFDVLPLEAGPEKLELQVAVRFKLPKSEEVTELPVLSREISVQVNYWWDIQRFLSKNWKWFFSGIGAVVVGVVGYLGKRWIERRS
jgi:hypothetical protein